MSRLLSSHQASYPLAQHFFGTEQLDSVSAQTRLIIIRQTLQVILNTIFSVDSGLVLLVAEAYEWLVSPQGPNSRYKSQGNVTKVELG